MLMVSPSRAEVVAFWRLGCWREGTVRMVEEVEGMRKRRRKKRKGEDFIGNSKEAEDGKLILKGGRLDSKLVGMLMMAFPRFGHVR